MIFKNIHKTSGCYVRVPLVWSAKRSLDNGLSDITLYWGGGGQCYCIGTEVINQSLIFLATKESPHIASNFRDTEWVDRKADQKLSATATGT